MINRPIHINGITVYHLPIFVHYSHNKINAFLRIFSVICLVLATLQTTLKFFNVHLPDRAARTDVPARHNVFIQKTGVAAGSGGFAGKHDC